MEQLCVVTSWQTSLFCDYFHGQWSGDHVVCERFERERVIGDARIGGPCWMRAIGADD